MSTDFRCSVEADFYITLLEMEVEALRSVLSEFEGDKSEYSQMKKADAIDELKNYLVRPE